MNIFDLSDEISVVIGGTGVLGGAIARGLAASGSKMAVLGRNQERGAQRVEEIESAGCSSQKTALPPPAPTRS